MSGYEEDGNLSSEDDQSRASSSWESLSRTGNEDDGYSSSVESFEQISSMYHDEVNLIRTLGGGAGRYPSVLEAGKLPSASYMSSVLVNDEEGQGPYSSSDSEMMKSQLNDFLEEKTRVDAEKITFKVRKGEKRPAAILIMPHKKLRRYWDTYLFSLLIYVATISVFVYSFLGVRGIRSPWFWIERFIDVSFLIDIILNFFTGYERRPQEIETDQHKIVKHYLKTWFVIDFFSTFPWDIIYLLRDGPTRDPSLLQLPRFLRLLRLLKLFHLVRLLRLKQSATMLEVKMGLKYGYLRLFSLMILVLLSAHWVGCLFYFFGSPNAEVGTSWITDDDIPKDLLGRYVAAVYFAVKTITTIGYGDITPVGTGERVCVIFIMFFGAGCFTLIISNVAGLVAEFTASHAQYRAQMDDLIDLARKRHLPNELVFKIRRYFQHRHQRQRGANEKYLLEAMSPDLRGEVKSHYYGDYLKGLEFLRGFSGRLSDRHVYQISNGITEEFYRPGEFVYTSGAKPDSAFVILSGSVVVESAEGEELHELGTGTTFGDGVDEILFGCLRRYNVRCVTYCEIGRIRRESLINILNNANVLNELRVIHALGLWEEAIKLTEIHLQFANTAKLLKVKSKEYALMQREGKGEENSVSADKPPRSMTGSSTVQKRDCNWETRMIVSGSESEDTRVTVASRVSRAEGNTSEANLSAAGRLDGFGGNVSASFVGGRHPAPDSSRRPDRLTSQQLLINHLRDALAKKDEHIDDLEARLRKVYEQLSAVQLLVRDR